MNDVFLGLGFLVSEVAMECIFNKYGEGKKSKDQILRIHDFCDGLENIDKIFEKNAANRKEISEFHGKYDDETAMKLLQEYDASTKNALEKAFDIFDVKSENEIHTADLDRVLSCLGRKVPIEDLNMLIVKLDPRGKNIIEYNNLMDIVMKYFRDHYDDFKEASLLNLKEYFNTLDVNGDGTLDHAEFKHVMNSVDCQLDDEETKCLIELLDANGDGTISYEEFMKVYKMMDNAKEMRKFDYEVRAAIIKLQYSALPDPHRYVYMYYGMPSNYRLSILADIEKNEIHDLAKIIHTSTDERDNSGVKFHVKIKKVTGVPSEEGARKKDILLRGVNFCVCRTAKPPTVDECGDDPEFVGNTVRLNAVIDSSSNKFDDVWDFSLKESDPDTVCYARITNKAFEDAENEDDHKFAKDLYLFVELVTTVRVPTELDKDKIHQKRRLEAEKRKAAELTKVEKSEEDENDQEGSDEGKSGDEKEDYAPKKKITSISYKHDNEIMTTVDLVSGWVMVPLKDVVQGRPIVKSYKMFGGTPFSPVKMNKKEIHKRPGALEAIKRFVHIDIKSQIQIEITPIQAVDTLRLNSFMPPSIILPSSAVSLVYIYRQMLRKARGQIHALQYYHSERDLPQTSVINNISDIVLSSFPKIMDDTAASRVLMYFWSYESNKIAILEQDKSFKPPRPPVADDISVSNGGTKKNTLNETDSNVASKASLHFKVTDAARYLFETLIVRMWNVFCHPDARRSRLTPKETVEQRSRRELVMRSIMEHLNDTKPIPKLNKQGKVVSSAAGGAKPVTRQKSALTESVDGAPLSATQAVALGASNATDYFNPEDSDAMMASPFNPFKEFVFTG